jgi:drug/metabolite transporter (DMT)-like permease
MALLSLLGVTIVWGGAFVGIKVLLRSLSYVDLTLLRFLGTSAIFLAILPLIRGESRLRARDLPMLTFLGALGVGAYHLSINFGERTVSPSVAALIVSSVPVLVALLSVPVLSERLNPRKSAGIVVALAGVAVLTAMGTPGVEFRIDNLAGAGVTVIAPAAWALNTVYSKQLVARLGPSRLTVYSVILGTILLLPLVRAETFEAAGRLSAVEWFWLLWLIIPCSVAGYLVWYWGLHTLDATRTAAFIYLVPLWAVGWAAAVLGDPVTSWLLVGGALVAGGVALVERRAPVVAAQPKKTSATE